MRRASPLAGIAVAACTWVTVMPAVALVVAAPRGAAGPGGRLAGLRPRPVPRRPGVPDSEVIARGSDGMTGDILVSGDRIYWTDDAATVRRVAVTGGASEIAVQAAFPRYLAADSEWLYWVEGITDDQVRAVRHEGGPATTLGDAEVWMHLTAAGRVLVANRSSSVRDGIYELQPGRPARCVAACRRDARLLGVVGDTVVWAENRNQTVYASGPATGTDAVIGELDSWPLDGLVQGDAVYVLTTREIVRVSLSPPAMTIAGRAWPTDDRTSVAADRRYLYWANPNTGMITRFEPRTGRIRDLIVDAMPSGVQVDRRYLYWTDLRHYQVMRTPLWWFDAVGLAGAKG